MFARFAKVKQSYSFKLARKDADASSGRVAHGDEETCFAMFNNTQAGRYSLLKWVEKQIEKIRNFFRKLPPWWSSKSLHRLYVAHRKG